MTNKIQLFSRQRDPNEEVLKAESNTRQGDVRDPLQCGILMEAVSDEIEKAKSIEAPRGFDGTFSNKTQYMYYRIEYTKSGLKERFIARAAMFPALNKMNETCTVTNKKDLSTNTKIDLYKELLKIDQNMDSDEMQDPLQCKSFIETIKMESEEARCTEFPLDTTNPTCSKETEYTSYKFIPNTPLPVEQFVAKSGIIRALNQMKVVCAKVVPRRTY